MSDLCQLIAEQPFFKDLSQEHIQMLAACAMQTWFESDELIFREGDVANRFYLIVDGEVALEASAAHGHTILIQTVGPGELLGWSWLFSPYIWQLHARALKPTHAIFFYGTRLRSQCEDHHEFGYEMFRRISEVMMQRLQGARRRLLDESAPPSGLRRKKNQMAEQVVSDA